MDQNQLTELLFQAATQHQGGRLQAAQEGYARVLALAPRNPEANHNSGVLAMQTGKGLSVALPFFRGAWEADPAHQQHWLSYLRALVQTGDMENAQNVLAAGNRHGLRGPDLELLKPRIAPPPAPAAAPNNSSQIDLKADARILARLLDERNFDAAEQAARKLTAAHPGHGLGWKVLGEALFAQNRFREALEATERAARISPADPALHSTLSNLLAELGLLREAEIALRLGLTLKPDHLPAQQALARLSLRSYRYAEAETAARKLLSQDAHSIAAWLILGESLFEQSRAADAEAAFREALRLHPGQTDAYRRLGNMLFLEGRETELSALSRQMRLDAPDYADAAADLARSLLRSGKLAQASEVFAQALELCPDDLALRDSWLFCCNYLAQLPPQELYDQARIYGEIASLAARPFAAWDCAPSTSKLRVGLVSGDLREHPVGYFLERVIANSDPTRIEWIVYATNRASDALSTRLQPQLSGWKVLAGLNDEDAARLIHQDAPHVLIDLAGHTADNRLSVFAWRPAPVQVSWLGYFATTGLPQMDYFLADRIGVPEESRHYFSEQVRYLPDTRLCFSPPEDAPEVAASPAQANGYITFGSFQATRKLNDAVLQTWAAVLKESPSARLRVQSDSLDDAAGRGAFEQRASACGIDPARLDLHGSESRTQYFASHGQVDILLDSFPFPGGTTTCEALWMGVPTVTLSGMTLVARQGASLLSAAGLGDWISDSAADYVRLALAKAADIEALAILRQQMRARVSCSPLFNAPRFAANLEQALFSMWESRTSMPPAV